MTEIEDLYQQLIMDHGRKPRNFGCLESPDCVEEGYNPLCGDKIKLYLKIHEDKVEKANFEGCGCAISIASASMMTEMLPGLTLEEVKNLFNGFHHLMIDKEIDELSVNLGKLIALAGVKAFPMRVKCATLAWHTLIAAIQKEIK